VIIVIFIFSDIEEKKIKFVNYLKNCGAFNFISYLNRKKS